MKIIHIFRDDKFPKMAHKAFENCFPGQNEFVIFTNRKELIHNRGINARIHPKIMLFSKTYLRKVIKGDIVVFHSMNNESFRVLHALPTSTKLIWIGWGFDYYEFLDMALLKKKSLEATSVKNSSPRTILKHCLKFVLKPFRINKSRKIALLKRINVFSPVLSYEYELVRTALPNFQARYSSWNYGTLEDDHIRGFENKYIVGNNILLGNSASVTNNHLDAFDLLENLDLNNVKVVTPLSYGSQEYRNLVVKEGNRLLGKSFLPLVDFMPIDEYIAVIQSCSVVVMNHLRQQALGNIVIALYLGAKVFLDERNPVFEFLCKQGAHIYKLQELEQEYQSALNNGQVAHNRMILKNYWSRDVVLEKTKNLVESALSS